MIEQIDNSNGKVNLDKAIQNLNKQKAKQEKQKEKQEKNKQKLHIPKELKKIERKDTFAKKAIGRQVIAMMIKKIKNGAKFIYKQDIEKFQFDGFKTKEHEQILTIINTAIEYAVKTPQTIYGPNTRQFIVDLFMAYGLCLCESKKDLEDFKEILKNDFKFDNQVFTVKN